MRRLMNHIGGRWLPSRSAEWLDLVNPATEDVLAAVPAGSAHDVDAAVRAASRAAGEWSARPLDDRLRVLERAAVALEAEVDALARIETSEMGRPLAIGLPWIAGAVAAFRYSLMLARKYHFVYEDGCTIVERRPVGVVALITPWNSSSNVILDVLGPVLACGNTVVLKPSEKSAMSAARMVELMGLPTGVVNLVLGDGRAGGPLAAHPTVGLTHFTGSVQVGRAVAAASAANLRRSVLKLGGKDPVLIDEGVDVDAVARDVARGAFLNSGQNCTSMERIYVHRAAAQRFVEALVAIAERYTYGDPLTADVQMGPLVDDRRRSIVAHHVEDAVQRGARIETGGKAPTGGPGFFYPATVLTCVTDEMLIMREETFGPVAPIHVVDSFEEGLEKARSGDYGLAATVYTNDPDHAKAARTIPAGIIWINQWLTGGTTATYEPAKQSGHTPTGHFASFDAATRPVSILRNPTLEAFGR